MRARVVVNPLAGGRPFRRRAVEDVVSRAAAEAGVAADIYVTVCGGDGRNAAREALDCGADVVVAWGGDGSVNEVAAVLAGTSATLGIVPAGSGNGLAAELCLPRIPLDALRVAFGARTRTIDVAHVVARSLGEARTFVNVAGFGFDAHVAARFNATGHRRGLARYLRYAVREIFRYRPPLCAIEYAGGRFEGRALLVAFANSRQYGNGAKVAPLASLDDGLLDLVIVKPTTPLRDLWRARRLFDGSMLKDDDARYTRLESAMVSSPDVLCGHGDGEPFACVGPAEVSLRPRALRVAVSTSAGKASDTER